MISGRRAPRREMCVVAAKVIFDLLESAGWHPPSDHALILQRTLN